MNGDEKNRRNLRISSGDYDSFYFYTSACNETEDCNPKIQLKIDTVIQKLMDENTIIKIEGLISLNQIIKSHQKYIVPKISVEIINEICLLIDIKEVECQSLRFLDILIQLCPDFYDFFVSSDFYNILIQRIQPDEDTSFYRQILLFLNSTINKIPDSIKMLLELGLLDNIRKMDQAQFIEQLQNIYSSSFALTADFSILDSILFYLTFSKSNLILETLECIKKCISDIQILEKNWKKISFDERLVSLLSDENPDIVSSTISIFTIIFSISDESIKELFENMEIVDTIIGYSFQENMNLNLFVFDFLISLIASADDISNITYIFELIKDMNIQKEMLEYLNYPNQQKIAYLIFNLYSKISFQQFELFYDPELLKILIQILQTNEEDLQFCVHTIQNIMNKFSTNEDLIQSISDIIDEENLDEYIFEDNAE